MSATVFYDSRLGEVMVSARRGTTRASIRRRNGRWWLIVPPGADMARISQWLDEITPSLLAKLPGTPLFSFDRPVVMGAGSAAPVEVTLLRSSRARRGEIFAVGPTIHVGDGLDLTQMDTQGAISRLLIKMAYHFAPAILLPRARQLAAEVGDAPASWEISRGKTTLGKCSSRRVISLSCVCVFLPPQLRDYIVWHELAHLREMNHSPRFHAICDTYCHGREKQLIAALNHYSWPVMR